MINFRPINKIKKVIYWKEIAGLLKFLFSLDRSNLLLIFLSMVIREKKEKKVTSRFMNRRRLRFAFEAAASPCCRNKKRRNTRRNIATCCCIVDATIPYIHLYATIPCIRLYATIPYIRVYATIPCIRVYATLCNYFVRLYEIISFVRSSIPFWLRFCFILRIANWRNLDGFPEVKQELFIWSFLYQFRPFNGTISMIS